LVDADPTFDLVSFYDGYVESDILWVFVVSLAGSFLMLFFGMILAVILLLVIRIAKRKHSRITIRIGKEFSWFSMIRRAFVPALFILGASDLLVSIMGLELIQPNDPFTARAALLEVFVARSLILFFIAMPLTMLLFYATWYLNDNGVVSTSRLSTKRECPESVGVGKWVSDFIAGSALIAFPLAMIRRFLTVQGQLIPYDEMLASFPPIIIVPLLAMSFILPFVILNEYLQVWISKNFLRIARFCRFDLTLTEWVGPDTVKPVEDAIPIPDSGEV
jgi:hypothetical protein